MKIIITKDNDFFFTFYHQLYLVLPLSMSTDKSSRVTWVPDNSSATCKCGAYFTQTNRRHHCRNCGGLVCNLCSLNKLPAPGYKHKVRTCDPCAGKPIRTRSGVLNPLEIITALVVAPQQTNSPSPGQSGTFNIFSQSTRTSEKRDVPLIDVNSLPPPPGNTPALPLLQDPDIYATPNAQALGLDDMHLQILVASEILSEFHTPEGLGGSCVYYIYPGERGEQSGLKPYDLMWKMNDVQGPTVNDLVAEKSKAFKTQGVIHFYIYNYKTKEYRNVKFDFAGADSDSLGFKVFPINGDAVDDRGLFRGLAGYKSARTSGVFSGSVSYIGTVNTNEPLPPLAYEEGKTVITKKMKGDIKQGRTPKQALMLEASYLLSIHHTPIGLGGMCVSYVYPGEVAELHGIQVYDLIYQINDTALIDNVVPAMLSLTKSLFESKEVAHIHIYSYITRKHRILDIDMNALESPTLGFTPLPITKLDPPHLIPENQNKCTEAWSQIGPNMYSKLSNSKVKIFDPLTPQNQKLCVEVWKQLAANMMSKQQGYFPLYDYKGDPDLYVKYWEAKGGNVFINKGQYIKLPKRPF